LKLQWQVDAQDAARVKALVTAQAGSALVRARKEHNLAKRKPIVTKERFWRAMVAVRLTSQQKSGPESQVVSADVKLTHCAEVKVTHLGEDGGLLGRRHVDPGASSGDSDIGPARRVDSADQSAYGAVAQHGAAVFAG
jgi:hypothetical protein